MHAMEKRIARMEVTNIMKLVITALKKDHIIANTTTGNQMQLAHYHAILKKVMNLNNCRFIKL